MEYMLDSANVKELSHCLDYYPIVGVTTNPSILSAEGKINVEQHLAELRQLCGEDRSFHVQLLSRNWKDMVQEARDIVKRLPGKTYVKVPVTEDGIKAIRILKHEGIGVTATAIYYLAQGLQAIAAGADYLAPYCNRMENNDIDFRSIITSLRTVIDRDHYPAKILAASFKNVAQVNDAIICGAHAVTLSPALLRQSVSSALISDAIERFEADYRACQF